MARTPLQIEIYLDHIHCYDEGDGFGSAEPYLWTIYFKIDGDSVILGDNLFLQGTATVVTTPGSHGNLGDTDVDAGDDVLVPAAIGDFQTTLKPISVPQSLRDAGINDVGGSVGLAVVLMEQDWVTDSGAEAGHVTLNQFVEQAINNLIPTLGVSKPDVTNEDIAALTADAADAVSNAVRNAQSTWHNVTSWLNGDDQIGSNVFTFSHDSFTTDAFQSFSQRWKNEGDWQLFGQSQGVPQCPVEAITSVLQAHKLIDEAKARVVIDVARRFRQHAFVKHRELGRWWQLVERNTAAIAGILHRNPALAKGAAAASIEFTSAFSSAGKVSDTLVKHTSALLNAFVEDGPRRLRIDAKAALATLPALRRKTVSQAVNILRKRPPTRKPQRAKRSVSSP